MIRLSHFSMNSISYSLLPGTGIFFLEYPNETRSNMASIEVSDLYNSGAQLPKTGALYSPLGMELLLIGALNCRVELYM